MFFIIGKVLHCLDLVVFARAHESEIYTTQKRALNKRTARECIQDILNRFRNELMLVWVWASIKKYADVRLVYMQMRLWVLKEKNVE